MSIETKHGRRTIAPPLAPAWGELAPEGRLAATLRFVLPDRTVTFPIMEFRRWEHTPGEPETLTISTAREQVVVEGNGLDEVRAALDVIRLCELRLTYSRPHLARPGPRIARITIETA
jgi:hypothetical protein